MKANLDRTERTERNAAAKQADSARSINIVDDVVGENRRLDGD